MVKTLILFFISDCDLVFLSNLFWNESYSWMWCCSQVWVFQYFTFWCWVIFSKLVYTFITFILLSEWRGKKRNTGSFFFLSKYSRHYNVLANWIKGTEEKIFGQNLWKTEGASLLRAKYSSAPPHIIDRWRKVMVSFIKWPSLFGFLLSSFNLHLIRPYTWSWSHPIWP